MCIDFYWCVLKFSVKIIKIFSEMDVLNVLGLYLICFIFKFWVWIWFNYLYKNCILLWNVIFIY